MFFLFFFGQSDQCVICSAEGCCSPLWLPVWQTQQGVHALSLGGEGSQEVSRRRQESQRVCTQLLQVTHTQETETQLRKHSPKEVYTLFRCVELWRDENCVSKQQWEMYHAEYFLKAATLISSAKLSIVLVVRERFLRCGWTLLPAGESMLNRFQEICGPEFLHFSSDWHFGRICTLRSGILVLDCCCSCSATYPANKLSISSASTENTESWVVRVVSCTRCPLTSCVYVSYLGI